MCAVDYPNSAEPPSFQARLVAARQRAMAIINRTLPGGAGLVPRLSSAGKRCAPTNYALIRITQLIAIWHEPRADYSANALNPA